jgi:hypothetical protein
VEVFLRYGNSLEPGAYDRNRRGHIRMRRAIERVGGDNKDCNTVSAADY